MAEVSLDERTGCLVRIRGLRFSFLSPGTPLSVIDGLSLDVDPGRLAVVLGPSGCGKTTLLRILAGLQTSSGSAASLSGEISLDDQDPVPFASAGKTEFLFQFPVLVPWLSVESNLCLPIRLRGERPSTTDIERALKLTQLSGFRTYLPPQLSGGMKQRAVLARALLRRPALMLMDEPFGSLDDQIREDMDFGFLRFLEKWRCTVLFVTHNLREAALLADELVLLAPRPTRVVGVVPGLPRQERIAGADLRALLAIEQQCRDKLGRLSS